MRETDRQTQTDEERQRERNRKTETERKSQRDRQTDKERQGETDRERETETNRQRWTERQTDKKRRRDRQRGTERETRRDGERDRQREIDKDGQTGSRRARQTRRDVERDRQTDSERVPGPGRHPSQLRGPVASARRPARTLALGTPEGAVRRVPAPCRGRGCQVPTPRPLPLGGTPETGGSEGSAARETTRGHRVASEASQSSSHEGVGAAGPAEAAMIPLGT